MTPIVCSECFGRKVKAKLVKEIPSGLLAVLLQQFTQLEDLLIEKLILNLVRLTLVLRHSKQQPSQPTCFTYYMRILSLEIYIFQVNLDQPVAPLILLLHLFPNCASFWDRPKLSLSLLTQSHHVFPGILSV